jgi:hypothetical protein
MALCVFLSMWVSNVAAAVLNVSFMVPILRTLPADSEWPKMTLLGICYACNVGGMVTIIASPQVPAPPCTHAPAALYCHGLRLTPRPLPVPRT